MMMVRHLLEKERRRKRKKFKSMRKQKKDKEEIEREEKSEKKEEINLFIFNQADSQQVSIKRTKRSKERRGLSSEKEPKETE